MLKAPTSGIIPGTRQPCHQDLATCHLGKTLGWECLWSMEACFVNTLNSEETSQATECNREKKSNKVINLEK